MARGRGRPAKVTTENLSAPIGEPVHEAIDGDAVPTAEVPKSHLFLHNFFDAAFEKQGTKFQTVVGEGTSAPPITVSVVPVPGMADTTGSWRDVTGKQKVGMSLFLCEESAKSTEVCIKEDDIAEELEIMSEKEEVTQALISEAATNAKLKDINKVLSHKLEVQTQRLELLTAQSMASENIPARPTGSLTSGSLTARETIAYADEGDEVVERVLGWIMKLFPRGPSKQRTSRL